MHDNKRMLIPVALIIILIIAGGWYLVTQNQKAAEPGPLGGSGTVEAVEVTVSPEVSGRVVEVLVEEGQSVQAGDLLFRLDDTLLLAQQAQAQTALEAAQAGLEVAHAALPLAQASVDSAQVQYDLELLNARSQAQPLRETDWAARPPAEFGMPVWYFTKAEEIAAAQAELDAATLNLEAEQTDFEAVMADVTNADLLEAEAHLAEAQAAFLVAQAVLDRAQRQNDAELRDIAQNEFDAAKAELDAAQQDYDDLLSEQDAADVLEARARLAVAQERYETALDRYNSLQTGEYSPRLRAAETALAQAQAGVTQAEAKITQAETAVTQAQAQLELLDVQLGKLAVYAPVQAVVLARSIEPGEVVQVGASALTLGRLDSLTITLYLAEDRYGEVSLGQAATVTVDSFPTRSFAAAVVRIADRAEFTPRNVQTDDGRRTTVFAIKLTVEDPEGLLKPGMPADVTFGQ